MYSFYILSLVAVLGLGRGVSAAVTPRAAVCAGKSVAIGSAANAATSGFTQYTIYDATSCAVKTTNVFATATGVCANAQFLCVPITKTIAEWDDPITGWAYSCTAATSSESCSSDAITYCVCNPLPPPKL